MGDECFAWRAVYTVVNRGRGLGNSKSSVWKLSGWCLVGVWWVSGGCLEGVLRMSGRCLKGVWSVSIGCLNGNLVILDWCSQDRSRKSVGSSSQDRSSKDS